LPHSIVFKIGIPETSLKQWEEIKPISCSIFSLRKNDEQILEELT
jgi:hypothetical protein